MSVYSPQHGIPTIYCAFTVYLVIWSTNINWKFHIVILFLYYEET